MLPSPTPQIALLSESSHLSHDWLWNMRWVLDYQLRWQASPLLKVAADVILLDPSKPIPPDTWVLHLVDKLEESGALGWHDEDGNEVPYGRIGIEDTLNDNLQPSEVVAHEALEMLYDPHVNLTAFDPQSGRLYPTELCDPVQGGAYDLGAPYGRKTGWIVSDFVTTGWFDPNTGTNEPTSYRHTVKGPFSLGVQGYVSFSTTLPPSWEQQFGEQADRKIADHDDRVSRRLAAVA